MDKLITLGFTVTGGQIDYNNQNYGVCSVDGPVLTSEGEALVKMISQSTPVTKQTRKKAAVVVEEAAVAGLLDEQ